MKPPDTKSNPAQGLSFAQQAANQYNQHLYQHVLVPASELFEEQYRQRTEWMWAGVRCTVEEFAERAYGDTPERTHFLLKYKGINQ
jgi:hypothetical protein